MAKITNTGRAPRGLPLINRKSIEIGSGETKDFPDADWAAIAGRKDVNALVASGVLKVEGVAAQVAKQPEPSTQEVPAASDAPAPKATRAKKG
jgi:hypothetical protein